MKNPDRASQDFSQMVTCPYCAKETSIDMPEGYAPVYVTCNVCNEKFIIERFSKNVRAFRLAGAAYSSSDPECNEIEMGASDEQ